MNIQEMFDHFGYRRTGWSNFAREAQLMYHREVKTWDEINKQTKAERMAEQALYDQWIEKNKDRIFAYCESLNGNWTEWHDSKIETN